MVVVVFPTIGKYKRRRTLQRLFSAFPGGWPGIGLVLLRAGLGSVLVSQSVSHLAERTQATWWTLGLISAAGGVLVLLGLLTPVAGVLGVLSSIVMANSKLSLGASFSEASSIALIGVISLAMVLLGPGAFSIDCRLFGRRQILIPHPSSSRHDR